MKKTAKNVLGLFFCILMISMCTGTIPAFAASSGMIHIQLEDLDSDSSDKKGVSFELYCVGTVGDSGEPVFDTKYNITAYPKTAEETEQVIQQISTALDIDAQETAVTDENGEAVFRGLADGIYYIKAVNAKGYGTVEPVLVHLPFSSAGIGAGSRLDRISRSSQTMRKAIRKLAMEPAAIRVTQSCCSDRRPVTAPRLQVHCSYLRQPSHSLPGLLSEKENRNSANRRYSTSVGCRLFFLYFKKIIFYSILFTFLQFLGDIP